MNNCVSFDSELCKFGIGLFETIKVEKGIAINLDNHINRLYNSIKTLDIDFSYSKEDFKQNIEQYICDENIKDKALRITIFDKGYNVSTRDIVYTNEHYKNGFKVTISPITRGNSILHKHKTTNYFENIYTKKYSQKNGFDEGLFVDQNNNILECSMSNIFFIKDRVLYTPSIELPILNGTMRDKILKLCDKLNIKVNFEDIKLNQLNDFDFCFLSNSLMGIMKVNNIDDKDFEKENEVFDSIWRILKNEK